MLLLTVAAACCQAEELKALINLELDKNVVVILITQMKLVQEMKIKVIEIWMK